MMLGTLKQWWAGLFAPRPAGERIATDATRAACLAHQQAGEAHIRAGAHAAAETSYRAALRADPDCAQAHVGLGEALRLQGRHADAAASCRAALTLAPDNAQAHHGLGAACLELGDWSHAQTSFHDALALDPSLAKSFNGLALIHLERGQRDEALTCTQQALAADPAFMMSRHLHASLTGDNPAHAPPQYVERLFNAFAHMFDQQLAGLGYSAPRELVALAARHRPDDAPSGKWRVLDLGCGTGLVGVAARERASQLVGVDLAPAMLAKARERGIYDRLVCGDITAVMQGEAAAGFDVIFSADTFIYVGALEEAVREARRLLAPGGILAFSVEDLDAMPELHGQARAGVGYWLQAAPSCRYAHAAAYLDTLAREHGFAVIEHQATALRQSYGKPIPGRLVLWRV